MHTAVTDLDKAFLHHVGGITNKLFLQILDAVSDDNDDSNQPPIIQHFAYYDFKKLTSTLNNFKNKFSIFNSNMQSINAQIYEFRIFVKCLKKHNLIFIAICIQKSWLSEVDDTSQLQLERYKCITQCKSCSAKGGLIIYLLDKFEHIPIRKLNKYNTWDGHDIQAKKRFGPS